MAAKSKRGMGKGLEAIFGEATLNGVTQSTNEDAVIEIDVNDIEQSDCQPRKRFDDEALKELAASIKKHGIMQPIIVQKEGERYRLIAGERRWRASRLAEIEKIPAIVRNYSSREAMELALIENLQREDLNAIEEAEAFDRLMKEHNLTQEELSETVGKSRSAVANSVRLLKLEPYVRGLVADGVLSSGHARTLLALKDISKQSETAELIIEKELNVRETEKLVDTINNGKKEVVKKNKKKDTTTPEIRDMENRLTEKLGTKVSITVNEKNKGKIVLECYNVDDFDRIIDIILK